MQRVFSTAGVSPYDQVKWEHRTAEIKDDKGNVVFEQDGVEVPRTYSKLATDIVASKYFYGAKGTGNVSRASGSSCTGSARRSPPGATRTVTSPPVRRSTPSATS